MFLPEFATDSEGSGSGSPTHHHEGDDGTKSAVERANRIFAHNPLHDYESVWWIAVWFVFYCKPVGVADSMMDEARRGVDKSRTSTFSMGTIRQSCRLLPPVLQPLGEVLVMMRGVLVCAYRSFEESFDDSGMLSVFEKLKPRLQDLARLARGLAVTPPVMCRKLNIEEAEFGAVALEGERDQQAMEQEGGEEE